MRVSLKLLLLAPIVVASFHSVSSCRSAAPVRPQPLVVASDLDNPPFAWVGEGGLAAGRDVEMMQWIAAQLRRELVWKRMPFEQLLDAAARGEVDVVCATLGVTPERAQRVLFSRAYFRTEIVALVRAGEEEPQRLADLHGARVAAGVGTTSADALRRSLPEATAALENKEQRSSEERLQQREVDAVLMDRPAAEALVRATSGQLRVLPEALAQEHYALVVAPTRAELLAEIDAALLVLERKGELAELDRRFELRASSSAR